LPRPGHGSPSRSIRSDDHLLSCKYQTKKCDLSLGWYDPTVAVNECHHRSCADKLTACYSRSLRRFRVFSSPEQESCPPFVLIRPAKVTAQDQRCDRSAGEWQRTLSRRARKRSEVNVDRRV
jgi:hypothetical protein